MIRLYHAPLARSLRVRWLLEELGVAYELAPMQISAASLRTPEYLTIHPLGKVPAIRDGDLTLFESGAILQYVLETYGKGRLEPAPGSAERPLYWQWFHFAEATLAPPLGQIAQHSFLRPEAERITALVPDARQRAGDALGVVEAALAGRDHLVGPFTAADVMMGYSVKLAKLVGCLGGAHPRLTAYLERLEARPALQRALA
jgi:glutathione S-transferase